MWEWSYNIFDCTGHRVKDYLVEWYGAVPQPAHEVGGFHLVELF